MNELGPGSGWIDLPPNLSGTDGGIRLPEGMYGPYCSNRLLAKVLIGLLLVQSGGSAVVEGLRSLVGVYRPSWMDHPGFAVGGFLESASMITVVVFAVWIHRSARNAFLFNGLQFSLPRQPGQRLQVMEESPGWCVGWYFLPLAMFWKPYQAMRDIFRSSALRQPQPVWLLPVWWALWVLNLLSGDPIPRVKSIHLEAAFAASQSGLFLALSLVAGYLVLCLTRMQHDSAVLLTARLEQEMVAGAADEIPLQLPRPSTPDSGSTTGQNPVTSGLTGSMDQEGR